MTQYDDDQDNLAALTFSNADYAGPYEDDGEVQALVFSGASDDDDGGQESVIDGFRDWVPSQVEDVASDGDAIRSQADVSDDGVDIDGEDDEPEYLATVSNPPRTVSVMALMDGSVIEIELSPKVAGMTEAALADEILTIADLARQKGLSLQRAMFAEFATALAQEGPMREWGYDSDATKELIEGSLEKVPKAEEVESAQAEVFATRYAAGTD
jgi:hypothetical protein